MSDGEAAKEVARRFFAVDLPRIMVARIEQFAAMTGTVAFTVRKTGAWTVRLGNLEEPISAGADDEADLQLWFSAAAFRRFVEGTLDAPAAVKAEELAFEGDTAALERLGRLLDTAKNAISARYSR